MTRCGAVSSKQSENDETEAREELEAKVQQVYKQAGKGTEVAIACCFSRLHTPTHKSSFELGALGRTNNERRIPKTTPRPEAGNARWF